MPTYAYNKMSLKSREELDFAYWLTEAVKNGIVKEGFEYEPFSYTIIDDAEFAIYRKMKRVDDRIEQKSLFNGWTYTPDFVFELTDYGTSNLMNVITDDIDLIREYNTSRKVFLTTNPGKIEVDTKGVFDRWHDSREFSHKQKALFAFHNVYINKVVPLSFFKKTWVPELAKLRTSGSPRMTKGKPTFDGCITIKEFLAKYPKQEMLI